ncbi:hypothetical protein K438DRAFT_2022774 [Mycena galopus ATCC 62051]|nr:hypothetical protein K438DRAFT_2022774 [Mycena galopus ATCC 62051]
MHGAYWDGMPDVDSPQHLAAIIAPSGGSGNFPGCCGHWILEGPLCLDLVAATGLQSSPGFASLAPRVTIGSVGYPPEMVRTTPIVIDIPIGLAAGFSVAVLCIWGLVWMFARKPIREWTHLVFSRPLMTPHFCSSTLPPCTTVVTSTDSDGAGFEIRTLGFNEYFRVYNFSPNITSGRSGPRNHAAWWTHSSRD